MSAQMVDALWLEGLLKGVDRARVGEPMARVFGLNPVQLDELFIAAGVVEHWRRHDESQIMVLRFSPGAALSGAQCALVCYPPRFCHPFHEHIGRETTVVLRGSHRESDGTLVQAGEFRVQEPRSCHEFAVEPGGDYLCAVALEVGVELHSQEPGREPERIEVEALH